MKNQKSVSFSLLIKFVLILSFAMLCLSILFVSFLRLSVIKKQEMDLSESISKIYETINFHGIDEIEFLELPYYIAYSVWDNEKKLLSTNDSLLPFLYSDEKSHTYFKKDFFTDGDLNIRYKTQNFSINEQNIFIECALDIANDSGAKMSFELPRLILVSLIPVLFLSYFLAFLISKQTISAFKKLQEDYDREKSFTSNVSHELKTPLAIIDGHANLLKRWGKDDPTQLSQSIDAILHETENMNSIVTTLLDMSRIENGKIKIEKSKFYVTNFFSTLKEEFKITHPDCMIHINDENFLEIETDEAKLHQIFTIILSNSVKFAGNKCKINLCAKKAGGKIELSATDDGSGFSPEIIPHVFERFYKGDSAHSRNVQGSGLGLSIAKSLAESLGAKIKAENSANGGAVIAIKF